MSSPWRAKVGRRRRKNSALVGAKGSVNLVRNQTWRSIGGRLRGGESYPASCRRRKGEAFTVIGPNKITERRAGRLTIEGRTFLKRTWDDLSRHDLERTNLPPAGQKRKKNRAKTCSMGEKKGSARGEKKSRIRRRLGLKRDGERKRRGP